MLPALGAECKRANKGKKDTCKICGRIKHLTTEHGQHKKVQQVKNPKSHHEVKVKKSFKSFKNTRGWNITPNLKQSYPQANNSPKQSYYKGNTRGREIHEEVIKTLEDLHPDETIRTMVTATQQRLIMEIKLTPRKNKFNQTNASTVTRQDISETNALSI